MVVNGLEFVGGFAAGRILAGADGSSGANEVPG